MKFLKIISVMLVNYWTFCFKLIRYTKPQAEVVGLHDGQNLFIAETTKSKDQRFLHAVLGILLLAAPILLPIAIVDITLTNIKKSAEERHKRIFLEEHQGQIRILLKNIITNYNLEKIDIVQSEMKKVNFLNDEAFIKMPEYTELMNYYDATKIIGMITPENMLKLKSCDSCANYPALLKEDKYSVLSVEIYKMFIPIVDKKVNAYGITSLLKPTENMMTAKFKALKSDPSFLGKFEASFDQSKIALDAGQISEDLLARKITDLSEQFGYSSSGVKLDVKEINYKKASYGDFDKNEWIKSKDDITFNSSVENKPAWEVKFSFSTSSHNNIEGIAIGNHNDIYGVKINKETIK